MNWKIKSAIQNVVAILPKRLSYSVYYFLQRNFGALKYGQHNPKSRLVAAITLWKYILNEGNVPVNKVFYEIGTGRVPVMPFAYYLMGANETITVDLNKYLKEDQCVEMVQYIVDNKQEVLDMFGDYLVENRLSTILDYYAKDNFSLSEFLDICNITYIAPLDAVKTQFKSSSIDYCTSYTVFEHIPGIILEKILTECNRVLAPNGLHIHRIDYSDHFSHSDKNISPINFLKYSDMVWSWYAGNSYMYMNRLRHDDFQLLFRKAKCEIVRQSTDVDESITSVLDKMQGQLDMRFIGKSKETLSTTGAWFVMRKY